MKEVRFSEHARLKIAILANHGIEITPEFIVDYEKN